MIPETFRVVRHLLDRIDDSASGMVTSDFQVEVPDYKKREAQYLVEKYGKSLYDKFPILEGVSYMNEENIEEMYLNKVWRPNLSIVAADGLPPTKMSANIVRPKTTLSCSLRLNPTFDAKSALDLFKEKMTKNVPHNARVTVSNAVAYEGWC